MRDRTIDTFVGRTRELAELQAAWQRAREGRGGVMAIRGEAGIGKTRLAEEFAQTVQASGGRVLWGRTEELAGAPPYWPWIEVIRGLLAERSGPDDGNRRVQDDPGVEVARLLREPAADAGETLSSPVTRDRARWRLYEGVATFLTSATADRPTLLVLDDLHRADESTVLLLRHLASAIPERPILLVVAYRGASLTDAHPLTAALAAFARLAGFVRLELAGLGEDEVGAYLDERLATASTPAVVRAVAERTDGNPFFLRELAAAAERSGDLEELVRGLPHGIREAVGTRLHAIRAESSELLGCAALLGEAFSVTELVTAAACSRADVLAAIDDAEAAGLIHDAGTGARYRFAHALVRDAVIARLGGARRAEIHGTIAARFESVSAEQPQYAERLAYHYAEAVDVAPELAPRAIEYLLVAAEAAGRQSAWGEAIAHRERALAIARRDPALAPAREAELLVSVAKAERAAGRVAALNDHYRYAIELYRRARERLAVARTTLAWLAPNSQYPAPDERRQVARDALSTLGSEDDALRARLLTELITTTDEIPDAGTLAAEARSLARRHALPDIEARLARWEAHRLYAQRRWEDYRSRLLDAAGKFAEAGDRLSAANTAGMAASVLLYRGRFDEAIAELSRQIASAERAGNAATGTLWRGALAMMESHRGERDRARALLRAAPLGPREDGQLAISFAYLAELDGDLPQARALLDQVSPGVTFPEAFLAAARARLSLIEGDESEARRELANWEPLFEKVRFHTPGCGSLALLEHAVTLPPPHRRRELLEQAARWEGFHFAAYGSFDRVRGLLALSLDRVDEAERHFRVGRDWAQRERCDAEVGRCELMLADVAMRRHRREDATRLVESALERARRHGGVLDARRAMERLERLRGRDPAHRAIDDLTARELEVLQHLATGETNAQIAADLSISPHTVANHVKSILVKTACANRAEAAAYAVAHHLAGRPLDR